ncbi:MAG: hypothetical protein J7539_04200 [Niabella sp.]|nr:hypothetical protein [Niabella sp.]
MRTLSVAISDIEFNKFGIKKDHLTFSDLLDIVSRELGKENLKKAAELADQHGLSKMTMEDITEEVKATRRAKNHN